MTRHASGGNVHNSPTAHGDHSIAANDIKNVIVKWVMHPSARWLPLLLACTAVVIAGSTQPGGPAGQYALWGTLSGLALLTAAARVLNRRPRDARVVGALSLVSVLATVGGWLAFQHVVAHGEVDVTGAVRIQGTQPLDRETNRSLTLLLDAPALKEARDALRLTLAIEDHDPAGPTCLPDSATVSMLTSGVAAQSQRIGSSGTVDFALGAGVSTVRIDVTVHTDHGCRMDISTKEAVLHDR
ncbi:hypothetical protein ACWQ06_02845 [Streptomyces angustmyceticus]